MASYCGYYEDRLSRLQKGRYAVVTATKTKLVENDSFWNDVLRKRMDTDVVLPLEYLPEKVRLLHDMLICPAGACAECCKYKEIPVYQYDIHRIVNNTRHTIDDLQDIIFTRPNGAMYIKAGEDGCPFLKDNACTIYSARPDACWLFPVMKSTEKVDGVKLIKYRIKCKSGVDVVRQVLRGATANGKYRLLPNLTMKEV